MRASLLLGFAAFASTLALAPKAEAYSFIQRYGCPGDTGAAWPERLLPSQWYIERTGYSRLPMREVAEVFERSIEVWGKAWGSPCCSGFSHELRGFTDQTPLDSDEQNVVGFAESSWPRYLGSPWAVIAVTFPQFRPGSCELRAADMLFNGVTFDFRTDAQLDEQNAVDLETIAVHEFGHWIGLDHSVDPTSPVGYLAETVMFPSYRGGIDDRALYLDDKLGACALYPTSCGACQADRDCPDGQVCEEGGCEPIECTRNAECPPGSVCGGDGRCHSGCRLHLECGEGFFCADGACLPDGECMTCKPCRRSRDCGGEYFCAETAEGEGVCTKQCSSDAECGGDSVCRYSQGIGVCAGSPTGSFCPDSYTCDSNSCPDLGAACGSCGERSDICVSGGQSAFCSCTCSSDMDCDDGRCLVDPATGLSSCYPVAATSACGDGYCPMGSACEQGGCVAACGGTLCQEGEVCIQGKCESLCPRCPAGEVCDPVRRSCVVEQSCLGVSCESGERCLGGACHTACGEAICQSGEECRGGRCVSPKKGGGGGCSAGDGGLGLGAALLLLALHLAARAPRRIA